MNLNFSTTYAQNAGPLWFDMIIKRSYNCELFNIVLEHTGTYMESSRERVKNDKSWTETSRIGTLRLLVGFFLEEIPIGLLARLQLVHRFETSGRLPRLPPFSNLNNRFCPRQGSNPWSVPNHHIMCCIVTAEPMSWE